MGVESFIENFSYSGPRGFATTEDIRSIYDFLELHPTSARLWNFCGDTIQLSDSDSYTQEDVKQCYESAIKVSPDDAEGFESLGFWHDLYGDLQLAVENFKQAIRRTDSDEPRLGIARVLAQLGQKENALIELQRCSDQMAADLIRLRDEIVDDIWSPE